MNRHIDTLIKGLAMIALVLALTACGAFDDDDDDNPVSTTPAGVDLNIVETAIENGNFSTLVAALQAAGLDDDLQAEGPFTVFAPTDAAFAMLPDGTIDFLLDPANRATLVDILTYHVFDGDVLAEDAIALDGGSVSMLNSTDLSIDVVAGEVVLNKSGQRPATVIITDIIASNGVIHVIDTVLDPNDGLKNIVETAIAAGEFNTLAAALQAAELDDDLQTPGPFTVFAPTDAAFAALPPGTVELLLQPENKALLIDILTYHVISGTVSASDAVALDGESAIMLNGGAMTIDVVGGAVQLNLGGNRPAMVITTDIKASNGVIHVIDMVLDPGDAG